MVSFGTGPRHEHCSRHPHPIFHLPHQQIHLTWKSSQQPSHVFIGALHKLDFHFEILSISMDNQGDLVPCLRIHESSEHITSINYRHTLDRHDHISAKEDDAVAILHLGRTSLQPGLGRLSIRCYLTDEKT